MKKVVLRLDGLDDKKNKAKVMKTVSSLSGLDSISMDVKDKKLAVIGDIDPIEIVSKLRKLCHAELVSVGPAKEPKNMKEEPKKQEKEEPKKQEDDKKDKDHVAAAELVKAYQAYNPHMPTYYDVRSVEDNPNACVIS